MYDLQYVSVDFQGGESAVFMVKHEKDAWSGRNPFSRAGKQQTFYSWGASSGPETSLILVAAAKRENKK